VESAIIPAIWPGKVVGSADVAVGDGAVVEGMSGLGGAVKE